MLSHSAEIIDAHSNIFYIFSTVGHEARDAIEIYHLSPFGSRRQKCGELWEC